MKEYLKDQEIFQTPEDARQKRLMNFLRDGMKLGYSLAGKNTSDFDNKTFKVFSPRLLSVMPDEEKDKVR